MPKKKNKNDYEVLDIDAALNGKDKIVKQREDSIETTSTVGLFDFVDDIRKYKKGTLLDKEQNVKSFDIFMTLRVLSMSERDIDLCNWFNQFQGFIPKKAMYEALMGLIPKDREFYKYINTRGKAPSELVECVATYYKIPTYQAQVYVDLMGEEWAEKIRHKFGGVIEIKK
jgi:hypothetical protein